MNAENAMNAGNSGNAGNAGNAGKPLAEMASTTLGELITRRLGISKLLERDGETLHLLAGKDGIPDFSITRLPGGEIRLDWGPEPISPEDEGDWRLDHKYDEDGEDEDGPWYGDGETVLPDMALGAVEAVIESNMRWAERKVRETAKERHPGEGPMSRGFFRDRYPGENKKTAARAAIETALLRTVGEEPTPTYSGRRIRALIRREIGRLMDAKAAGEAARTMNINTTGRRTNCNMAQYNALVRHGRELRELQREAPLAAMIWWNHLTRDGAPQTPDGATSADMAQAVRNRMEMKPAQWRLLMDIGDLAVTRAELCTYRSSLREIRDGTAAVTQANIKDPCPTLAAAIIRHGSESTTVREEGGEAAWKHWVWAVRQALLQHQGACPGREDLGRIRAELAETGRWNTELTGCGRHLETLRNIRHAITWHQGHGERWRNSNWRNLIVQATRWALRVDCAYTDPSEDMMDMMDENEYRTPLGEPRSWDSLIGKTLTGATLTGATLTGERKTGTLTAVPMTTSGELLSLGREMRNCIPYYDEQCARGDVRIFSLHMPGGALAGAAEIVRKMDRGWVPGETQAMDEQSSHEQLAEAAAALANLYQEAENRTHRS